MLIQALLWLLVAIIAFSICIACVQITSNTISLIRNKKINLVYDVDESTTEEEVLTLDQHKKRIVKFLLEQIIAVIALLYIMYVILTKGLGW